MVITLQSIQIHHMSLKYKEIETTKLFNKFRKFNPIAIIALSSHTDIIFPSINDSISAYKLHSEFCKANKIQTLNLTKFLHYVKKNNIDYLRYIIYNPIIDNAEEIINDNCNYISIGRYLKKLEPTQVLSFNEVFVYTVNNDNSLEKLVDIPVENLKEFVNNEKINRERYKYEYNVSIIYFGYRIK